MRHCEQKKNRARAIALSLFLFESERIKSIRPAYLLLTLFTFCCVEYLYYFLIFGIYLCTLLSNSISAFEFALHFTCKHVYCNILVYMNTMFIVYMIRFFSFFGEVICSVYFISFEEIVQQFVVVLVLDHLFCSACAYSYLQLLFIC